ncbi:hypothetical protein ABZY31_05140 [Streptomyces sp. NPDC006529]|uniref:hypothetical protein n=1 Tax=Streptomyces sp. NPDC006529 TaxID=3157177 RepID=UPI0033B7F8F6
METVSSTAIAQLAEHLRALTETLDPGAGWYGEFLRRDPEGVRACLDGTALAPWDVMESLLQDVAALRGPREAAERSRHAARLRRAAALAHDRMPGGEEELHALLAAADAQRGAAEAAVRVLTARLSAAPDPAAAAPLARELAWTRDDLARAASRCADLTARLSALTPLPDSVPPPRWAHAEPRPHTTALTAPDAVRGAAAGAGAGAPDPAPLGVAGADGPRGGWPGPDVPGAVRVPGEGWPVGVPLEVAGGDAPRGGWPGPDVPGAVRVPGEGWPVGVPLGVEGADAPEAVRVAGAGTSDGVPPDAAGPARPRGRGPRRSGGARFAGAAPESHDTGAVAAPPGLGLTEAPAPVALRGARFGRPAPARRHAAGSPPEDLAAATGAGTGRPGPAGTDSTAAAAPRPATPQHGARGTGVPGPDPAEAARLPWPNPAVAVAYGSAGPTHRPGSAGVPHPAPVEPGFAAPHGWPGPDHRPAPGGPAPAPGAQPPHPHPAAYGNLPGSVSSRVGGSGAAAVVGELIGLRGQGRSGEAHALLGEAAGWDAALLPGLGRELERAGLAADWAALLWEAASLPPDRLAAVAAALGDAGRHADGDRLLRQGAARPAPEIADTALALGAAGRAREADALLEAFVRVRTAEEAARLARRDPGWFGPRLLAAARGLPGSAHRDLAHAFRVAGIATS